MINENLMISCLNLYTSLKSLIRKRQHYPSAIDAAEQAREVLGQLGMSMHAHLGMQLQQKLESDTVTGA